MKRLILGLALGLAACGYCTKEETPPAPTPLEERVDASIRQGEAEQVVDASYVDEEPATLDAGIRRDDAGKKQPGPTPADEYVMVPTKDIPRYREQIIEICRTQKPGVYQEMKNLLNTIQFCSIAQAKPTDEAIKPKSKPIPGVGVFEEICPGLYSRTFPGPRAPEFNTNYGNRTVVRGEFGEEKVFELLESLEKLLEPLKLNLGVEMKREPIGESDNRTSYKLNEKDLYLWVDTSPKCCKRGYTLLTFFAQRFPISEKETYKQRVDSLVSKTEDILAPVEEVNQK